MDNTNTPAPGEAEVTGRQKSLREYTLSDAFIGAAVWSADYYIAQRAEETARVSTYRATQTGGTVETIFKQEDLHLMDKMLETVKTRFPEISTVTIGEDGAARLWTHKGLADFNAAAEAKTRAIENYVAMPWYKKLVNRDPRKPEPVGGP